MKPSSISAKGFFVAVALALLYLLVIQPLEILEIPRLKTQDLLFSIRRLIPRVSPAAEQMLLVRVDDESIERLHERWPFRRRIYADLVDKLAGSRPRLIAFDLIFAGRGDATDDFLLGRAIADAGNVVLASYVDQERNYVVAREELRKGARGSGVVNLLEDRDFSVRRKPLFFRSERGDITAWTWEAAIACGVSGLDQTKARILKQRVIFEGAEKRSLKIPLHGERWAAINYRLTLEDVASISLWEALERELPAPEVEGKIVLIGATSRGLHDYYRTPLGLMPGVVVNMNFLANLLADDFLFFLPPMANALLFGLMGGVGWVAGLRFGLGRSLLAVALSTAGLLVSFFALLLFNGVADPFGPLASGWTVFLVVTLSRYARTLLENVKLRGETVTDPLTGLYNRRFLEGRIDAELDKLVSEKRGRKTDPFHELSVLMIDVDNFKKINDTYGHQFGDDVLKTVAFTIREGTRKDDIVARFGGEEFCVVLVHTHKEAAAQIAEKIRNSVEERKLNYVNQVTSFTVSIGVASARADNLLSSRALIRTADMRLYEAKKTGKNRVCLDLLETKQ
jgi:diguanylate cyclase (GGDEF)-like protein